MKVRLQSYPPLGQVTSIQSNSISFKAVLDAPSQWQGGAWEVVLWHSVDESPWEELILNELEARREPVYLQVQKPSVTQCYFGAKVSFRDSIRFTLKFRHANSQDWIWVQREYGFGDGMVIFSALQAYSTELVDYIPDLNPAWTVSPLLSQAPQTSLWSLKIPISASANDVSAITDATIGTPWGGFYRWFALVRHGLPWMGPRQGGQHFRLDKDAILASFLGPQGQHLVFLAVSDVENVSAALQSLEHNVVSVHARNESKASEDVIALASVGQNFERTVAAVMYHARNMRKSQAITESKDTETMVNGIRQQWMQQWYDGLGFCTWNSLGQNLTEGRIHEALKGLKDHDIEISTLIIDDNWQSIDPRQKGGPPPGWRDFEANPEVFPDGLKATVDRIRSKYPSIRNIAVWHAILGYWGGISKSGQIAKSYRTTELKQANGFNITVVDKEDISNLYNDFYRFLSESGIDGVKTDDQVALDLWTSASARRELTAEYFDAWTIAALRHLNFKTISCMSQFPQALFHSQLPQNRPPMVVRNSDDFFPEIPASHTWHIWANAHNSIFMQYLNVVPDWDMFQTSHEFGGFHAAARCVSGGPIYITDAPGEHDKYVIDAMTGKEPQGSTVTFRPSVAGKSIYPYAEYGDYTLLKVGSYNGLAQTGVPILGVFNVTSQPLTEILPLSDFSGIWPSSSYVVRAHSSGKISPLLVAGHEDSQLSITLEVSGYDVLSAFPVNFFDGHQQGQIAVANLGLLGKMTGCAAITSNNISSLANGRILVDTRLKALGVLGIYISILPQLSTREDLMVTILGTPIAFETVAVSGVDDHILEIDIAKAWKLGNLNGGWSNEVEVKVYFNS